MPISVLYKVGCDLLYEVSRGWLVASVFGGYFSQCSVSYLRRVEARLAGDEGAWGGLVGRAADNLARIMRVECEGCASQYNKGS